MIVVHRTVLVLCVLGMMILPSLAFADEGQSSFERGVEAYNGGHYDRALAAFQQAQEEGLDRPALLLNLGVSAFRLQNYPAADEYFAALAERDGWVSTGYYYRGRVAERQGQNEQATQWYRDAIAAGDSEQAQRRSQAALLRVDEVPQPARHELLLLTSGGYDSNPALLADTDFADEGEPFVDVFANYAYHLADSPWRLEGTFFTRQYPGESDLSDLFSQLGASRHSRYGQYLTHWGAAAGQFYFGGDHFQDRLQLSGGVERVSAAGGRAGLDAELNRISADRNVDELDGVQSRTTVSWRQSLDAFYYRTSYRLEWNDREDFNDGENRESLSPIRHRGRFLVGRSLTDSAWLEGQLGFEHSRYQGRNTVNGDDTRRVDQDRELTVRVGRVLASNWQVFAAYTFWDRDSTIDRFDTDRHQWQVTLIYRP